MRGLGTSRPQTQAAHIGAIHEGECGQRVSALLDLIEDVLTAECVRRRLQRPVSGEAKRAETVSMPDGPP
jgi:hypothetical protein